MFNNKKGVCVNRVFSVFSTFFVFLFTLQVGIVAEGKGDVALEQINEAKQRYDDLCGGKSNEDCYALMLLLFSSGNKADEALLSRHLCLNVVDVKRDSCLRLSYQANKHKQAIQEESCKLGNEKACALKLLIQKGSAAQKEKNRSKLADFCRKKKWAFACFSAGLSISGKNKTEAVELLTIGCDAGDEDNCKYAEILKK
jgi:hypothetical protein